MDRLNHLFPHYDQFPQLAEHTLPDMKLDTSKLDDKRETTMFPDKFGDFHIIQKSGGNNHVIVVDFTELEALYRAARKHEMEK